MTNINPSIFKAYDVRGIYPDEINEEVFYILGKTFAAYLNEIQKHAEEQKTQIIIGQDIRLSSPSLAEAFIKGVLDSGFDVLDIGQATTPMFSFAVAKVKAFGGAMITASHNPANYNGLKLAMEEARYISGEEFFRFYQRIGSLEVSRGKKGEYKQIEVASHYLDFVTKNFQAKQQFNFNIVVDASCGTAALFLPEFLKRLEINYTPICFEIDGTFSKHNPNPALEESQKFAKEKIVETKADFGVIFDGDGDRIIVLDENARLVRGDALGGVIAGGFLKEGDKMVYDLVSTRALRDYLKEKGIKTSISRVGHFFIKKEMKRKEADFGSEVSGHYFFKNLHYAESAFYALRMILEAMNKNLDAKISDLAKPFLKYFNSGVINFPLETRKQWQKNLSVLKKCYQNGKQNFEDGILVEYADWWFNLRPSNTEPIMKLIVEADTQKLLEEKKKEILEKINIK
jgi:phosphomannomutase